MCQYKLTSKKTKMIKLSPNLFVTSVKESIAFYEKFGFTIVNDLHKTFYGTREFAVQDPDGYICVFAER